MKRKNIKCPNCEEQIVVDCEEYQWRGFINCPLCDDLICFCECNSPMLRTGEYNLDWDTGDTEWEFRCVKCGEKEYYMI